MAWDWAIISREFDEGDFPGVVDPLKDGEHGIAILADIGQQLRLHFIDRLMDDLFRDLRAAKAEAVLEKSQVDALQVERFDESADAFAGFLAEAFPFHIRVGFDQQRFAGFHFTAADADLADAVHQLADQLELEARLAKSGNAPVWFVKNPAAFHGIEEMVAREVHGQKVA